MIFFMLSFVFPILFLISLIVLYVVPMTIQLQKQIFTITEIIYAWSALDVMVASLIISLIELKVFV